MQDVSTLDGVLDRRVLELGQVLAREREDGGSVLGLESDEVGSAALVAVGRAPESKVGDGAQVDRGLDRLMGRAVLTETNGVVGGDPDDLVVAERRQTDGTSSVADEVLRQKSVRTHTNFEANIPRKYHRKE